MKILLNKVAVVTGAGSGMGRAICLELAKRGVNIALVDINTEQLQETERQLKDVGVVTSCHCVDVSNKTAMQHLPEQVIAKHGEVHIIINNAGVSVATLFEDQSIEDIEWITGINYWGVIYGCKFFLPYLKQVDEAHIVNLSSSAGFTGMKNQSSYAATKFAVRGLSESLYVELAKTNIGISCIHPGAVATNILESARIDSSEKIKLDKMFDVMAMKPEKAARLIVNAIVKNRFKRVFCFEAHAIDWLKRIMPIQLLKIMRLFYRLS
jgi:NADP-dependent 3-hydroxy acid dehydrogenase YdfG